MNISSLGVLYADTPSVTVNDNRGLAVRQVQYNRTPDLNNLAMLPALETRISQRRYNTSGHTQSEADARLVVSKALSFQYQSGIAGQLLQTQSTDAGPSWGLADVEGRPVWQRDARSTTTQHTYDVLGRPLTVSEQRFSEETAQPLPVVVRERRVYGDNDHLPTAQAQAANLVGALVVHWDTAGVLTLPGITLGGQPQGQIRRLLLAANDEGDWTLGDVQAWQGQLEPASHTTQWQYDALGGQLSQTDAMGNTQTSVFDVAGKVQSSALTLKDGTSHPLLTSVRYSAAGQVQEEVAGNGVTTHYHYQPQTQRLLAMRTERAAQPGQRRLLQDLRYSYDPVGNGLSVEDLLPAEAGSHAASALEPNTYLYDALYQLVAARAYEQVDAPEQGRDLPTPLLLSSLTGANLSRYQRGYQYDWGGNLTQIRHQSANTAKSYTHTMVVAADSNRALPQDEHSTLTTDNVGGAPYFDRHGNSLQLQTGQAQPLRWNGRNQLASVIQVQRVAPAINDQECYQYDAGGMRVRKTTLSYASGGTTKQCQQVIYLPGLELRVTTVTPQGGSATTSESLQVITGLNTGRAEVRVLHWDAGQPDDIDNDQYRYSLGNLIGSATLEVDGQAQLITLEEYYPYGGTAIWGGRNASEVKYKFVRYSGKERDATGLYYYGYRYYLPWVGRWLSTDPAGTVDGPNLYRMVRNNPIKLQDPTGLDSAGYNMYSSTQKTTTVYRVEPSEFNEKYTHLFIENNNALIYYPKAAREGRLPNTNAAVGWTEPNYTRLDGRGYVQSLTKTKDSNGDDVEYRYLRSKVTPSGKAGLSDYEYARLYLANNKDHPQGTMGWLGFNNPQRAYDFYAQKTKNEGEKFEFVVKSFEIPSGVYKAIAETALTEGTRYSDRTSPINVDVKAHGQFGLQSHHLDLLNKFAIPGSGKLYKGSEINDLVVGAEVRLGTAKIKLNKIRAEESAAVSKVKFKNSLR
ncbi:RHS repeat-associated core domain-containing protein [Pseudomonas chlororaphis]|uniref:RHS repeat-associated core domain-containing protein n=1 Tax=Pseudomonas chlororaphis TaxID=587753 RepID=UPI000BE3E2DF|nr:RHS repeat-associated core domain-containing protein [Pseudomonas chlororaphis]